MKMISVMAAVFALAITGCKKDDINNPGTNPGPGQFNVNMTDAPANFARMDITIDGVEAWHDSQGWIVLSSNTQSFNVLSLSNGSIASVATASNVQSGHYSRLRIHFTDSNSVTVHSAVTIGTLFVDAGAQTSLAWDGPADHWVEVYIDKDVSEQSGAEVLIDFDAANSVYEASNSYALNPSIREMINISTGARGSITGADGQAFISMTDGVHTYSAYANSSGSFMIRGMTPGTYSATIWASVRNEAGVMEELHQMRTDIRVTNNTIVNIGAVNF